MPAALPFRGIDTWETSAILVAMNEADSTVPAAVAAAIPQITQLVDAVVEALRGGGRLHLVGAGTSGRLAVMEAYECPPTFGIPLSLVQAHLPGGAASYELVMESLEDDAAAGALAMRNAAVCERDVVVGITASGNTPYVCGALREAASLGAVTGAVVCTTGGTIVDISRHAVIVDVGPEIVSGSTRLKAGTAQKLVLNMVSTATFIRLGHVFDGLMVAVQPENAKLLRRAVSSICTITGAGEEAAREALDACDLDVRAAIVMLAVPTTPADARSRLDRSRGNLRRALNS
jgi:N-acetylmuramic acid 6-phosphate etherase